MRVTVLTLTTVLALSACAAPAPRAFPVLPALPAEVLPLPPVSSEALVWQPGDWVFFNGSYRYDRGHYVPAAGHGSSWIFGRWDGTPAQPIWIAGSWN